MGAAQGVGRGTGGSIPVGEAWHSSGVWGGFTAPPRAAGAYARRSRRLGGSGHRGEGWAGQVTGFVSVELIKLIQKGAAAQFKDLQVPPRACAAGWDAPGLAPSTCVHTAVFPPHQFLMVFAAMIFVVICSSLFIWRSACVRCRRIWRCRC